MNWLFPCSLDDFDIHAAFKEYTNLDWSCTNHVEVGDSIYIYVAKPDHAIRYKCVAVEIGKEYTTIDDERFGGNPAGSYFRGIEIQLLDVYPEPGITIDELRAFGIRYSFQSKITLSDEIVQNIEAQAEELKSQQVPKDDFNEDAIQSLPGAEREAIIKVRVNQSQFRKDLLKKYDHCALCGVANKGLLIASHIKPWAVSNGEEKTDVDNGLLLCPNHDSLFDKGLISFDKHGDIVISEILSPADRLFMNINENMHIDLIGRMCSYMAYHLKYRFRPGKLK